MPLLPNSFARFTCALLVVLCATSSGQAPSDSGLRWEHAAGPEAYIPGELSFGLHDNHVWSTAGFGSRRLMLFDAVGSSDAPRGEHVLPDHSIGVLAVAAAKDGSALFSVTQYALGPGINRRTEFTRYDAVDSAVSAPFLPTWTAGETFATSLTSRIATDAKGNRLVAASWDGTHVNLLLYDGQTGTQLSAINFPANQLLTLEVSDSGDRIAVLAGAELWIFNAQLNLVTQQVFPTPPSSFALSRDGSRLVAGFRGYVEIYREQAFWALEQIVDGQPDWIAARVDLDRTGDTAAIGWWNVATGTDVRFELRHGPQLLLVFEHEEFGSPGGLQNLPQAAILTPDGRRAAFACWGDSDADPEVLVVDRESGLAVLSLDLPGSVRGLDLDSSGTRVAVSLKESHANLIGFRGSVQLYDTGERDLQLRAIPSLSTGLEIWHKPVPLPHVAYLGIGRRAPTPTLLPGGAFLGLDRAAMRTIPLGFNDMPVSSSFSFGSHPGLRGQEFSLQTLFRTPRGWRTSTNVVDFTLL